MQKGSSAYLEPTGRGLTNRAPSMPELKEDQILSGEVMTNGIDELQQQHGSETVLRPRLPSGVFSGAGDSGVWPGAAPATGALAFITPMTVFYILVWYITGALTNSTSKQTLSLFKSDYKPFLSLTLMQHLAAACCGAFAIRVLRLKPYKALPVEAMSWGFYRLISVYTLGFCLTNGSFGKVNAGQCSTALNGQGMLAQMSLEKLNRSDFFFFPEQDTCFFFNQNTLGSRVPPSIFCLFLYRR